MNNHDEKSASEKRVVLDLKITKLKHSLNEVKNKSNSEYEKILKELEEALKEQKEIDAGRFYINCSKIKEINIDIKQKVEKIESNGLTILKKLSLTEQNFLKENNYDCILDEYKIFSTEKSPDNPFIEKWKKIQIKSHNKSLHEYYKDKDWNN